MATNLGFGPLLGAYAPAMAPRKRSWQARAFDRLMPSNSSLSDEDKTALTRQGLLNLGIGLLTHGGGFGNALGQSIGGGLLSMSEGSRDLENRRYQQQLMGRTLAGAERNRQVEELSARAIRPDGSLDQNAYRQLAGLDPERASQLRTAIEGKKDRYQAFNLATPGGGQVPVFYDPTQPGDVLDITGRPVNFGNRYGAGNIDLTKRPTVRNADGSISTVRSFSTNIDGEEVLLPMVSDDGRIVTEQEAIANYLRTGRNLGKFRTPEEATAYAESLHRQQEQMYSPQRQILSDAFFQAQEQAESGGDPNAVSPKGAFGPMQIMPATARDPGYGLSPLPAGATPEQNREFGQEYMRRVTAAVGGDPRMGLAAYNWGPANVQRLLQQGATPEQVLASAPKETRDYVTKIMGAKVASADPYAGLPGYAPPKPGKGEDAPSGYRFNAAGELEPIKGGPADRRLNPTPADQAKGEMSLRKELADLTKDDRTVVGAYQKVQAAGSNPSAQNDLALIFAYMKMLDPGSVVREGEFANAQNAAGIPDRVRNAYNKAISGERLNDSQRAGFISSAKNLNDVSIQRIAEKTGEYAEIATQYGWDPFRATGTRAKTRPSAGALSPAEQKELEQLRARFGRKP